MDISEDRKKSPSKRRARRSAAPRAKEVPNADGANVIPVTVKTVTERLLTDGEAFNNIPTPPPGMCLDLDAMEDDESGAEAPVLFTPEEQTALEPQKPDRVELVTGGELRMSDGCVELMWRDCHAWGAVEESVSFDPEAPGIVTLRRRNRTALSMILEALGNKAEPELAFVLERGRWHISICRAPDGPAEIAVRTFRLENSLIGKGRMLLDFSVEIHGVRAEKTRMLIKIKREEHDTRPESAQNDTICK